MSEDNKALVRALLEGADRSDISVIDRVLHADYVDHNPPPFQGPATGADGARDGFNAATKIFSDWKHEVLAQYSDGDYVISRIVGRGRHSGEFLGIPASDADVSMEGIAIHRVVDGRVVEHWSQVDAAGLLAQIGVLPPMGG
jgi:predicted ester cyclase